MYSHPWNETVCYSCQQKQRYSQLSLFCGQPIWHRQVIPWFWWNPSGFWFIAEHGLHEWSYTEWSYPAFSRRNIAVPRAETEQFCPNKPELASLSTSVCGSALCTQLKRTECSNDSGKSSPEKKKSSCTNAQHHSGQPGLAAGCTTRVSFQYAPHHNLLCVYNLN